jgi:MEMO1 family protein
MRMMRVLLAVAAIAALIGASEVTRVCHPIVAGIWYPAEKDKLVAEVERCMSDSDASAPPGRIMACIVPHAPYSTFGTVAGAAFKLLKGQQYNRVVVLAPAHYSAFRGCSIPSVQGYRTPLGDIPLDGPAIRALDRSPLIEVRTVRYNNRSGHVGLHEREYTVEVVLPFLQQQLGSFELIPILVGDFVDYNKGIDAAALESVADTIRECVDEHTLIVVSSDFTHFGNKFSYRPFHDNIIAGIETLDKTAFNLILKKDFPHFLTYLDETQNKICGKNAIAILLKLLPKNAEGSLLKYEVSARRSNDTTSSISYASIVFVEPSSGGDKK